MRMGHNECKHLETVLNLIKIAFWAVFCPAPSPHLVSSPLVVSLIATNCGNRMVVHPSKSLPWLTEQKNLHASSCSRPLLDGATNQYRLCRHIECGGGEGRWEFEATTTTADRPPPVLVGSNCI